MSLFDKVKGEKRKSTKRLIGAAAIDDCCLFSSAGSKCAFLIVSPVNLNVLSASIIQALADNLAKSVKEIGSAEMLAVNSAQSYEHNKRYLNQQLLREQNDEVKDIDKQDIEFLDDIQIHMATSREFLLKLCFSVNENRQQIITALERARQSMMQNGFLVRVADKHDIKRLLAIYFEQNIYEDDMQDFDGERYSPILEMKK